MRCAMYPPPPGSAPGYQNAHHCRPRYTVNVITGRAHIAWKVKGREKSGKKAVGSAAAGPAAARIAASFGRMGCIPPTAAIADHAKPMTEAIFRANLKRT